MATNPVERNPVTRYLLGFAVIAGLFLGGGAGGWALSSLSVPYGAWIGTALGAVLAFALFSVAYTRYDASVDSK